MDRIYVTMELGERSINRFIDLLSHSLSH
jgi:hypothetical protein